MVFAKHIICRACQTRLEPVAESEGELWFCPACGVNDTHEDLVMPPGRQPAGFFAALSAMILRHKA